MLNNEVYHYVKNLQGDVVRILDENGNTVVEYSYDPWGVPTVTGDTELAKINPCSYRGYDYDEETGYYYLQSRYYNPEIGRFISGDEPLTLQLTSMELMMHNLYSYCNNNPVNDVDSSGYLSTKDIMAIIKSVFQKVTNYLSKYLKSLFVYNAKKKTLSIHTDLVSGAINTIVSFLINKTVYNGVKAALKTLLKNDSIRKEFVKKTFEFFVENWVGRLVLKKIVTIGLGIVGIKKWTQTAKDAFVSNLISNIITSKWKFLSAPSSLISAFASFGGIVAFFFDWVDGKWNSYVTIKIA